MRLGKTTIGLRPNRNMTGRPGQTRPLAKEKGGGVFEKGNYLITRGGEERIRKMRKYLEKENNQTAEEKKIEDHRKAL